VIAGDEVLLGVSWYARTISRSDPKCFFLSE
jgi:hypothetical protein